MLMPIRRITDIFAEKPRTCSFEFFPPKTPKAREHLYRTAEQLMELKPDYFSVTYGAGGSTTKSTMEIIQHLQQTLDIPCMHHLTLVGQRKEALAEIIREMMDNGIRNVLALRGDPPPEMGRKFCKVEGGLEYAYELIDLIRHIGGDYFAVGVAGFPEGHQDCPTKDLDTLYLKIKLDHGADFVVSQFFFENSAYTEYLERTAAVGVRARILPGVLPITDYRKLVKFCKRCGAYICQRIHDVFQPLEGKPELTVHAGAEYAVEQCRDLLERGAPGLHFYCLNSVEPVRTIWNRLRTWESLTNAGLTQEVA
jgi:methylenetetrahydrofolate reductase (NADPH)